jgi:hypothetical protein
MVFFRLLEARKHPNFFPYYKRYKIQEYFGWKSQMLTMDYREEAKIQMKKQKMAEIRIKKGEIFILHPQCEWM